MPEFKFTKQIANFGAFLKHMETETGKAFLSDPLWATIAHKDEAAADNLVLNAVDSTFTQGQLQGFLDSFVDVTDKFTLASDKTKEFDGVPKALADNVDLHTITITKVDSSGTPTGSGTETLQVIPMAAVAISTLAPVFVAGTVTFTVGPIATPCDFTIEVADPAENLGKTNIRLRFA